MNKANKITMSRIILSVIILIILLFPFHQIGIDMPSYIVNGNITIEIKYIIAGEYISISTPIEHRCKIHNCRSIICNCFNN